MLPTDGLSVRITIKPLAGGYYNITGIIMGYSEASILEHMIECIDQMRCMTIIKDAYRANIIPRDEVQNIVKIEFLTGENKDG